MAKPGPPPDYYRILEVSETATTQQIRDAYKKAALKTHPDRVAADSPERPSRTRKFQLVNDAYYTLSDSKRRREYDAQRRLFGSTRSKPSATANNADPNFEDFDEEIPLGGDANMGGADANTFFSWAWDFFTGSKGDANTHQQARQEAENAQFADVFEEMLREEGMDEAQQQRGKGKFWALAGGAAGGVLGFIAANFPGAIAGVVAGNRFGAIRDARGKSVYEVFQELPQSDRTRLLAQLATRVFSHAVG
ncbi:hypothetical protein EKO27_g5367 [Xylaria grammica]|uniref:J domain-containing protein n=1 Tax=Xylaria grammica TaxID=363999 RepID=A0A439D5Q7_9PEZI|nr:hypothetical protein EKO27_g5367 [Xylaria grammica]